MVVKILFRIYFCKRLSAHFVREPFRNSFSLSRQSFFFCTQSDLAYRLNKNTQLFKKFNDLKHMFKFFKKSVQEFDYLKFISKLEFFLIRVLKYAILYDLKKKTFNS